MSGTAPIVFDKKAGPTQLPLAVYCFSTLALFSRRGLEG